MSKPIQYVADISNVREISLLGTADLNFWNLQLRDQQLELTEFGGRAQILVIAAELKFWGIRFREINFSILCRSTRRSEHEIETQAGSYLLRIQFESLLCLERASFLFLRLIILPIVVLNLLCLGRLSCLGLRTICQLFLRR